MGRTVFVPAFAKINLTLDVLGKRADGYHELASVMQTLALADTLTLTPREDDTVTLTCDNPELENEQNLALRAAKLALAESNGLRGIEIELAKVIPTQAGLGGGSSDGAATLIALNALLRLGKDENTLRDMGAHLGSDVPFFICGGTALIEGRGESVTPLPDAEPLWIVLVKPQIGLATASVFSSLAQEDWSDGAATKELLAAIRDEDALPLERLTNSMEAGVLRSTPAVANAQRRLLEAGAPIVRLSGSGPTLFAPFRRLREAAAVARSVADGSLSVWLTHTIGRAEVRAAQALEPW